MAVGVCFGGMGEGSGGSLVRVEDMCIFGLVRKFDVRRCLRIGRYWRCAVTE